MIICAQARHKIGKNHARDEVIIYLFLIQMIFPRIKGSYMQCGLHVHNLIKDIKKFKLQQVYTHTNTYVKN